MWRLKLNKFDNVLALIHAKLNSTLSVNGDVPQGSKNKLLWLMAASSAASWCSHISTQVATQLPRPSHQQPFGPSLPSLPSGPPAGTHGSAAQLPRFGSPWNHPSLFNQGKRWCHVFESNQWNPKILDQLFNPLNNPTATCLDDIGSLLKRCLDEPGQHVSKT